MSPAPVVHLLERISIAGATANVRQEHRVASLREKLRVPVERIVILGGRAAVSPNDARQPLPGGNVDRSIEVGRDLEPIRARVGNLLRHQELRFEVPLGHREGQLSGLSRLHRHDVEVLGSIEVREREADLRPVGRPGRVRHPSRLERDEGRRGASGRIDAAKLVGPVVVLDEDDRVSVRRPRGLGLVSLRRCQGTRLASPERENPVVDPPASQRRKQHRASVRRDEGEPKGASRAVVEEVPIAKQHAVRIAARPDGDHIVVHPARVQADVEDLLPIGRPGREDLILVARRQPLALTRDDRHCPDVVAAVPVPGKSDLLAVGRPAERVDSSSVLCQPSFGPVRRRPQPDLGSTGAIRNVRDPLSGGGPARHVRGEKVSSPGQIDGQSSETAPIRAHRDEARARGEEDSRSIRSPLRRLASDQAANFQKNVETQGSMRLFGMSGQAEAHENDGENRGELRTPLINHGEAPRASRRPSRQARGGRIPGVFDRRATPRDGMHRRPNAGVVYERGSKLVHDE